jgi:tetratricopeptide (TPR) repeat protein
MEQNLAINQIDEKELIEKAEDLKKGERWQEIISLLRPYHHAGKLSIEGLKMLSYSYSRSKEYDEAICIYQDLSQKQPHEAIWPYCLAFQFRGKKDLNSAIEAYEKCLEIYPQWLKVFVELGKLYEEISSTEKAHKVYHDGIQIYKTMKPERQKEFATIYSKLCTQAAKLICSAGNITEADKNEAEYLFKESITADPQNADTWYRLGDFLLESGKYDEAIQYLQKAESLAPKKEYIPHKIAQAYLKKGNPDQALEVYEAISHYKRSPYILHGMAECLIKKGELKKGAYHLYIAAQREPEKWYHYRDLGLVLANLGDRDQAIDTLEKANRLYKKENGKDFNKILAKVEELKEMPKGESINFEKRDLSVTTISYGVVTKYNSERGFGFIKDDSDGTNLFFHISKVKNRSGHIEPAPGIRVKFAKEIGEKGPQASKVWVISNSNK